MRVSEARYTRDRRALEVASRLIDFEARTHTIRVLTGLTDCRIRSLSKVCGSAEGSRIRPRHRGKSPHRVELLLSRTGPKREAAALVSLCQLMGVASGSRGSGGARLSGMQRVERLCDVYWTYRYLMPDTCISFEQMLLLLSSAAAGEIATMHCEACRALLVVDAYRLKSPFCLACEEEEEPDFGETVAVPLYRVAEEPTAY